MMFLVTEIQKFTCLFLFSVYSKLKLPSIEKSKKSKLTIKDAHNKLKLLNKELWNMILYVLAMFIEKN
jgi:hypothetical protein